MVQRDNQRGIDSNARIIEWEDGSKSLAVGEEIFDLDFTEQHNTICGLSYGDLYLMKQKLAHKALIKPAKISLSDRKPQI